MSTAKTNENPRPPLADAIGSEEVNWEQQYSVCAWMREEQHKIIEAVKAWAATPHAKHVYQVQGETYKSPEGYCGYCQARREVAALLIPPNH